MTLRLTILFLLTSLAALGENLFVRPNGGSYGTETGVDWENAFDGFSDVSWGSGDGNVGAGDTLYVGAGTYTQKLTPGASGTAGNPITIRAAQETQVGIANFSPASNPAVDGSGISYIVINGEYSGAQNFNFTKNISYQNMDWCEAHWLTMTNAVIDLRFSASNSVSHATVRCGANEDFCINGEGSDNIDGVWNQSFVTSCNLIVNGQLSDGEGADGIKAGEGFTIRSNRIQAVVGAYSTGNAEHQDLIAMYGNRCVLIEYNDFIDTGDSQVGHDGAGSDTINDCVIRNNTFRMTVSGMGSVMVRFYSASGPVTTVRNINIDNNTFIDASRTAIAWGAAIRVHTGGGTTTATNASIRNNIIYNCGLPDSVDNNMPPVHIEGFTDNWDFSNNLINAGNSGTTVVGGGWVQDNGQTGAPTFVSYTEFSMANDLRLASGDTAAKDNGVTITTFSTDKDGIARPQGAAWDIGAYEYQAGEAPAGPVANVQTMNAGSTFLRQ